MRGRGWVVLVVLCSAGCSAPLDELDLRGQVPSPSPSPSPSPVCEGPELHVVALYQPLDPVSGRSGVIDLLVERPGPVVLFIDAFRAAEWRIATGPDTDLQAIFIQAVGGPQVVRAPISDAAITRIGRGERIPCVGYEETATGLCSDRRLTVAGVEERLGLPVTSYVAAGHATRITIGADLRFDSDTVAIDIDRRRLLGLVLDTCRVPAQGPSPECVGLAGRGRLDVSMCTNNLGPEAGTFTTQTDVTCEEALALCRFNVEGTPWMSFRCQWEGRTLMLHQPTYFCWDG